MAVRPTRIWVSPELCEKLAAKRPAVAPGAARYVIRTYTATRYGPRGERVYWSEGPAEDGMVIRALWRYLGDGTALLITAFHPDD